MYIRQMFFTPGSRDRGRLEAYIFTINSYCAPVYSLSVCSYNCSNAIWLQWIGEKF